MASPPAAASSSRRKEKISRRLASFNRKIPTESREFSETAISLRRVNTQPELFAFRRTMGETFSAPATDYFRGPLRLTKLLLNVTVHRSLGHIHIVIASESTVEDLIIAVLGQYAKERRRPVLPFSDPSKFGLHYSQFSLERLEPKEKVIDLGSRNFFLCPKPIDSGATSCSGEAKKAANNASSTNRFTLINLLR